MEEKEINKKLESISYSFFIIGTILMTVLLVLAVYLIFKYNTEVIWYAAIVIAISAFIIDFSFSSFSVLFLVQSKILKTTKKIEKRMSNSLTTPPSESPEQIVN